MRAKDSTLKSIYLTGKSIYLTGICAAIIGLGACSSGTEAPNTSNSSGSAEQSGQVTEPASLASVISHPRRAKASARDQFRHPLETLEFFEVGPGKSVTEIWPGWYSDIIAPYLAENGGTYTASTLPISLGGKYGERSQRFVDKYSDVDVYGNVSFTEFFQDSYDIAPAGSQDVVLTFRNVHNWMKNGFETEAFKAFYDALKPGGILGIVEHRLPESATQDPKAASGYVQESYMKALAEEAGFEFVGASEVNANPRDTADHPFGVWTLPPRSKLPKDDDPQKDGFDAQGFVNIGESDRATLKFRKPL